MFERLAARFPTRFRDTSVDYGVDVFLKDFSATGLSITTRQQMFIDDVLSIEVKMPDKHEPVKLSGRVRWVRKLQADQWNVGAEYHRVDFMHVNRLVRYALAAQHM